VDRLGSDKGNTGEKKKRKKQEFIVNYYVVATEFFNEMCPLTGSIQKKALGKDGVNAWGANKEELKTWFKENDLDLGKQLKMTEIRTTAKNLMKAFENRFPELTAAIKEAKEVKKEEKEKSAGESSADESSADDG